MISYIKKLFQKLKFFTKQKNSVDYDYIKDLRDSKEELSTLGIDMHIDESSGSFGIIFPQNFNKPLTIEDLNDELFSLTTYNTDYLVEVLGKYVKVFSEYDISIITKGEDSLCPYVYKTRFPESIVQGPFVPVIGENGINTINKETLSLQITKRKIFDYTIMLDNNIMSNAEKYFSKKIEMFCDSFKHIESQDLNYDPSPYLIEQLIIGYEKNGDNFRLNKHDSAIAGLIQNVKIVHQNLNFVIKDEKKYIDTFINNLNKMATNLFRYYNINKLSLIYILEARALFTTKQIVKRKRSSYRKSVTNRI